MLNERQLTQLDVQLRGAGRDSLGLFIKQCALGETAEDAPDMQGAYEQVLAKLSQWLLDIFNNATETRRREKEGV